MGYTHYHSQTRSFSPLEWASITGATAQIIRYAKDQDIYLDDDSDADSIFLNGSEARGEDCETLIILRDMEREFSFCKTRNRPYDLVVCMILLACHHHASGALTITSDGDVAEWQPAMDAYRELFQLDAPKLSLKSA